MICDGCSGKSGACCFGACACGGGLVCACCAGCCACCACCAGGCCAGCCCAGAELCFPPAVLGASDARSGWADVRAAAGSADEASADAAGPAPGDEPAADGAAATLVGAAAGRAP